MSFVLAGAVLRGPGPLPRARSGRGKRWHTCRLCWQARYLEALDLCRARARAAGNAGRRDTRVVSAGRRGTWRPWTFAARGRRDTRVVCAGRRGTYIEALDLCRARARAAGNAGRRDTRVCWQARYLEALDLCRARARAAGNAGRRDTRVVSAGRRGTWRPWTVAARALGPRETLTGATHVSFVLAGAVLRGPGPLPRARARAAGNAGRRDTRVVCAGRRGA